MQILENKGPDDYFEMVPFGMYLHEWLDKDSENKKLFNFKINLLKEALFVYCENKDKGEDYDWLKIFENYIYADNTGDEDAVVQILFVFKTSNNGTTHRIVKEIDVSSFTELFFEAP